MPNFHAVEVEGCECPETLARCSESNEKDFLSHQGPEETPQRGWEECAAKELRSPRRGWGQVGDADD